MLFITQTITIRIPTALQKHTHQVKSSSFYIALIIPPKIAIFHFGNYLDD